MSDPTKPPTPPPAKGPIQPIRTPASSTSPKPIPPPPRHATSGPQRPVAPGSAKPVAPAVRTAPTETKRALLDALQESYQAEQEKQKDEPPPPPVKTRPAYVGVVTVLIAAGLATMVSKPAWLVTPPRPPESAERQDASIRVVVYMQAEKIFNFRARKNRLPNTLAEAGGIFPTTVQYRKIDESRFELIGTNGVQRVTYRSDGPPLSAFLGNAFQVIARKGQ